MTAETQQLTPPYDGYLRNGSWDKYIDALSLEGMIWWFNLNIGILATHLTPLFEAPIRDELPPRIRLFSRIVQDPLDTEELERLSRRFLADGDSEAAAAALFAAVLAVWESGADFWRLDAWHDRIDALADGKIHTSILARLSLIGVRHMIAFAVTGDWRQASESGRQAMLWSGRAGSNNLRVCNAMMYIWACLWNIDPSRLETTLSDTRILCGLSDVSSVSKSIFQLMNEFYRLLSGKDTDGRDDAVDLLPSTSSGGGSSTSSGGGSSTSSGGGSSTSSGGGRSASSGSLSKGEFEAKTETESTDRLGHSEPGGFFAHKADKRLRDDSWLLGRFLFLQAAVARNDATGVKAVVESLLLRRVEAVRPYHAALYSTVLAAARLAQGKTGEAGLMADSALDFTRRSGAAAPEHHIRMLTAQIQADGGNDQAAIKILEKWKGRWRERGYHLYVVTAHLEIARIRIRRGDMKGARRAYDRAARRWVFGPVPHAMNRSRDFVLKIRAALDREPPGQKGLGPVRMPDHSAGGSPAVEIKTFGGLRIRISGVDIDEGRWRGRKTKALLKALIVWGGADVSNDWIMDALWPDADGDRAAKNLKITLHRLRRLGCRKKETPLPWIRQRNRRISLDPEFCRVDVFQFREWLSRGMRAGADVGELQNAADLYRDDFLPRDRSAEWIAAFRRQLRAEYADAVSCLGQRLLNRGRPEAAAEILEPALKKTGLDADLHALLIQARLDLEQYGKARAAYDAAVTQFQTELGLDPDPKLIRLARDGGIL